MICACVLLLLLLLLASAAAAPFEALDLDGPIVLPPHPELPGDPPMVSQPRVLLLGYVFEYAAAYEPGDCSLDDNCAATDSCCNWPLWPYGFDVSVYNYFYDHVMPELSRALEERSRNLDEAQPSADDSDAGSVELPLIAGPSEIPLPPTEPVTSTARSLDRAVQDESDDEADQQLHEAFENELERDDDGFNDIPQSEDPDVANDDDGHIADSSCLSSDLGDVPHSRDCRAHWCSDREEERDGADSVRVGAETLDHISHHDSDSPVSETFSLVIDDLRDDVIVEDDNNHVVVDGGVTLDGDYNHVIETAESVSTGGAKEQWGDETLGKDDNAMGQLEPSSATAGPADVRLDEPETVLRGRGSIRFRIPPPGSTDDDRYSDEEWSANPSSPKAIRSASRPSSGRNGKVKSLKFMSQLRDSILGRRRRSRRQASPAS